MILNLLAAILVTASIVFVASYSIVALLLSVKNIAPEIGRNEPLDMTYLDEITAVESGSELTPDEVDASVEGNVVIPTAVLTVI